MAENENEKEEVACPGETFIDNADKIHQMDWHEDGKCKFCKGRGRRSYVGDYPEIDRQGKPVVDFCCHQCKENYKNEGKKINVSIRTSVS